MNQNFAILGVAGFIAPKHLKAIKETNNNLVAALDPQDSVGVLDNYFPQSAFFTEYERFDRFLEKQRRANEGQKVDYLSICTPNYLHDAHCRLALRLGASAICEKPLTITPWNVDQLAELEAESPGRIYNVLQLRHMESLIQLKNELGPVENFKEKKKINLTYITRRGPWYHVSWKGDLEKSGGIATNIGIHFFDFLIWIFGPVEASKLFLRQDSKMSGHMELAGASVSWFLSVDEKDLPQESIEKGEYAYRSITLDGQEIPLSSGFTDLHTKCYQDILSGKGYGLIDAKRAIEVAHELRTCDLELGAGIRHPMID